MLSAGSRTIRGPVHASTERSSTVKLFAKTIAMSLIVGTTLPILSVLPASAATKSGQLCAKSAENTQVAGLTCAKDASGKLRWSTRQVSATVAPTVPKTTPKAATTKATTKPIPKIGTNSKTTNAAQTATTVSLSPKTAKTKAPAAPVAGTTASAAQKGRFCKKDAIGRTAKDSSGVLLKCSANPNGGTPQWTAA